MFKMRACVEVCPIGCLDNQTFLRIEARAKNCISCGACLKAYPEARALGVVMFLAIALYALAMGNSFFYLGIGVGGMERFIIYPNML
ncbi:MAG: hypothetical protein ABSA11_04825 [Candidatus Bathyarchaeia archaeon]|jgi:ferredoxin